MDNILFIGNSLTFYNEMPKLLKGMAKAAGIEVDVHMVVKSGWPLHGWVDEETPEGQKAKQALSEGPYRFVVFHDQSANPVKDPEDFYRSVKTMTEKVRAIGATPVLYQTWAYRDGSEILAPLNMTKAEMYVKLRDAYRKAAEDNAVLLAPAGDHYYAYGESHKDDDLLAWDARHPTLRGSMISAATILRTMYPEVSGGRFIPFTEEDVSNVWETVI